MPALAVAAVAAAFVSAGFLMAGCTHQVATSQDDHSTTNPSGQRHSGPYESAGSSAPAALPELDRAALVRDAIGRTEQAIMDRTSQLASAADSCDTCASALTHAEKEADLRLKAAGGTWLPWGDPVDAKANALIHSGRVEIPAPVSDAPFTVDGLIAFMVLSAQDQLEALVRTQSIEPADRVALAGVLSGRIVSVTVLAEQFDVDVQQLSAELSKGEHNDKYVSLLPDLGVSDSGEDQDTDDPRPDSTKDDADRSLTVEEQAAITYDCIHGTLLEITEPNVDREKSLALNMDFEIRVDALRTLGAKDLRSARCILQTSQVSELLGEIVRTDLSLFASDDEEVRSLAATVLWPDSENWARLTPEEAVGSTILVPVEDAQDNSARDAGTDDDQGQS